MNNPDETTNQINTKRHSKTPWILFCIVLLGLGLRLLNSSQPYWGDEVLSLSIAQHFHSMLELIRYIGDVEFHPPGFYILLQYWVKWFGPNPVSTHIMATVFSVATIILTYFFGQKLFQNKKASLIASFLIAILPFQLQFSNDARPYTLICFLGMLGAYFIWQYYQTYRKSYIAWYIIVCIIGLYIHYSFFMLIGATSLWSLYELIRRKKELSRQFVVWLSFHAAIALGFSFWLKNLLYKIVIKELPIYGINRGGLGPRSLDFIEHNLSQVLWFFKDPNASQLTISILFLGKLTLVSLAIYLIYRLANKTIEMQREALVFLAFLVFIPLIIFLFVPFSIEYSPTTVQHLIYLTVPVCLLLGWAFSKLEPKKFLAIFSIFILTLVPFSSSALSNAALNDPFYQLQSIGEFIDQQYEPGDIVLVPFAFARVDLQYYLKPGIPVVSMVPINYYGGDFWNTRDTLGFVEEEAQTRIIAPTSAEVAYKLSMFNHIYNPKRVWLVMFTNKDYAVHNFYQGQYWDHRYRSILDIYLLDLYVKPQPIKK